MRGRFGELGRLSSRETGANLAAAPSLANTGEQGSEAVSRRISVPRVRARAWGSGAPAPSPPVNTPRPRGEAVREPGPGELGYSRIPSGHSWKSGQMTRLSWDLAPPGLRDRDLCLALVRDFVQCAEAGVEWPGLGRDLVWLTGTQGESARSLWSTGLYILTHQQSQQSRVRLVSVVCDGLSLITALIYMHSISKSRLEETLLWHSSMSPSMVGQGDREGRSWWGYRQPRTRVRYSGHRLLLMLSSLPLLHRCFFLPFQMSFPSLRWYLLLHIYSPSCE